MYATNMEAASYTAGDDAQQAQVKAIRHQRSVFEAAAQRRLEVEQHVCQARKRALERRLAELQNDQARRVERVAGDILHGRLSTGAESALHRARSEYNEALQKDRVRQRDERQAALQEQLETDRIKYKSLVDSAAQEESVRELEADLLEVASFCSVQPLSGLPAR